MFHPTQVVAVLAAHSAKDGLSGAFDVIRRGANGQGPVPSRYSSVIRSLDVAPCPAGATLKNVGYLIRRTYKFAYDVLTFDFIKARLSIAKHLLRIPAVPVSEPGDDL